MNIFAFFISPNITGNATSPDFNIFISLLKVTGISTPLNNPLSTNEDFLSFFLVQINIRPYEKYINPPYPGNNINDVQDAFV
jgi:hypothetical protein